MIAILKEVRESIDRVRSAKEEAEKEIELKKTYIDLFRSDLYRLQMRELHLTEIYRLASKHLPRLRKSKEGLNETDHAELGKWINRCHSPDGLKSIVDAIATLEKYQPEDIKVNLYGLVQKIIIEGPYNNGKKK